MNLCKPTPHGTRILHTPAPTDPTRLYLLSSLLLVAVLDLSEAHTTAGVVHDNNKKEGVHEREIERVQAV
jgi:hypothetical protein